jgi:hypothetical protein
MHRVVDQKFVYNVSGKNGFDFSHCHKPTPIIINDYTIRVFFGTRDDLGRTRTTFVDLDRKTLEISYIHTEAVLDLGKLGTFDDCGANVCSLLRQGSSILMYFIGWNPGSTVHTRNAIGCAISKDGGYTFERLYDGAVLDRNATEPYYTGAVDVLPVNEKFYAWYTSGSQWELINGKPEIFYHIKLAFSVDGLHWERPNQMCIPPKHDHEVTARPSIWREDGKFYMLYSRRDIREFRDNATRGYRAGLAVSEDGIKWQRCDEDLDFLPNNDEAAWDSEAIAYPYVLRDGDEKYVFYNGNGFGASGFGVGKFRK